jgi:serine/threonine protein kinase
MPEYVGQQIGNYQLIRLLGQGAFADVYQGEHRYLKTYAALKLLRTTLSDKEVEAFLAEAQILGRLAHPQIVRVLDFLVERGTAVLIMDFAPGGTLRQHYPQSSRLSLEKTMIYVKHIAAALQYAHNRAIIHRDVKPENMLLGSRQEVLLGDFGISLLSPASGLMSTQEMAGTVPYIAPEQLRGKPVFASDQYSLAVVTYEWLCGKRPFEGKQWEVIQQHLSALPPPLREIAPELSIEVESVVLKALAKEPQQRFVSVQAFAYALERAVSQVVDIDFDEDVQITLPMKSVHTQVAHSPLQDHPPQHIFLTAAPDDDTFAVRLQADLTRRGLRVWRDRLESVAEKEETIRHVIRNANLVVVILSSYSRSSRIIREHMRIANMYEQRMVFFWAEGNEISEVLPIPNGWGKTSIIDVIDAREAAYGHALEKLLASLEHATPVINIVTEDARLQPHVEPRNPYKGLRAFTVNEAIDFFGREALVDELVENMKAIIALEDRGNLEFPSVDC